MRVKRSVDFRMAPKKSSKGKGTAVEPTREEGWMASKCSESDLGSLVSAGLLPEKSIIQWRPALGEDRPLLTLHSAPICIPQAHRSCSFSLRVFPQGLSIHETSVLL